jgi:hypothetical protein
MTIHHYPRHQPKALENDDLPADSAFRARNSLPTSDRGEVNLVNSRVPCRAWASRGCSCR